MPRQSSVITRTCEQCGRPFETKLSQMRYGFGRFCSKSCATSYLHRNRERCQITCQRCGKVRTVPPSARYSKYCSVGCYQPAKQIPWASTPIPCDMCGEPFKPKTRTQRFCGQRCAHERLRQHNHEERNSWKYRDWRDQVFERDQYTCQYCHQQGGHLNAHHVWAWMNYPALRFDVTNGITLCRTCHRKVHDDALPLQLPLSLLSVARPT